jgi:uncharacterized protein (DUF2235 family)
MPKNIVICCDGTGNEYCKSKTNVAKLFDMVENHTDGQIAYYDPGVGTLGSTLAITWVGKKLSWLYGLAFAFGLVKNIEDAYSFLMENYEDGDRIFLFGFSRGAYTVRALAGMIMKCGLLYKQYPNLIEYATKLYRNRSLPPDHKKVQDFRKAFSRPSCVPYFIGVWDTVKSVGLKNKVRFSDMKLSESILYGYHALSIDEKRFKFRPVLWDEPAGNGQTIEQVWFPGVHSDVGGSYPEAGLSDGALKWMLNKAAAQGLVVNIEMYDHIVPNCADKLHRSFKGFWLLLWFYLRPISKNALVHASAVERMDMVGSYRPPRLPKMREKIKVVE